MLTRLTHTIALRVAHHLERQGLLEQDTGYRSGTVKKIGDHRLKKVTGKNTSVTSRD